MSASRRWVESLWYRVSFWHVFLLPLAGLFSLLSRVRRVLYVSGWIKTQRLPVPVIVVGNITVGGSGKTPLVLWLTQLLKSNGYQPGIVSRGYGGSLKALIEVDETFTPAQVGDEPMLLMKRSGCPVFICPDRGLAARAMLARRPEVNVIVADDGLQHYKLPRDIEIAVVDGERGFGNGFRLPAGPLREPISRLKAVQAVVVNGRPMAERIPSDAIPMRLIGDVLYRLNDPSERKPASNFVRAAVHAIAGIGNPGRFFTHLRNLGLRPEEHRFPDHYAFQASDLELPGNGPIVMTEKDAVKCAAFVNSRCWVLAVDAELPVTFSEYILSLLSRLDGFKAT
ncbi:MAG TPA: tetraacyldisaccharide 4'-kinase [Burkholderiales bacterium]|nr:tetraacyldisaccharide 4'-kinase [Burkholderiales bacterium]